MSHDVYVCYDEKDKEISDVVCDVFEKNNIEPWVKSRSFLSTDSVDKIINAITDSKCFILILSKHSKDATHVITETDLAFSRDVPILALNIDNSKLSGNLEFILNNQNILTSFSDSKEQLEHLVKET